MDHCAAEIVYTIHHSKHDFVVPCHVMLATFGAINIRLEVSNKKENIL